MKIKIADRFELWPLARLVPYERNSRLHSDGQVAGIADSIRTFGFLAPIVVDTRRNRIAAGHGRLLAARLLGMPRAPVIAVDHLTESQFRAYVIADNKHTDNSAFDMEALAAELADLAGAGFDLAPIGFTEEELASLLPEIPDDDQTPPTTTDRDAIPDAPIVPTSVRGDVVLDLFGGSGSTLIACEILHRIAKVMELDPRFVDVIVQRWQGLTGRLARLAATGETFGEVVSRRAASVVRPLRSAPPRPSGGAIMLAGRPFAAAANDDEFTSRRRA